MIRLLVVDDHKLVRKCLCAKLESVPDFRVIGEADSGERARQLARELEFDVILMDLNMPGIGGLETTRRILSASPTCRVLGLSMYVEGPYPRRFLEIGGAGYVSKNSDTDELILAIREVHRGGSYISRDVAQQVAISAITRRGSAAHTLTQREIEVLQRIASGMTSSEIALRLCLSPKTVTYHRRRLYDKLGVDNDVKLVLAARDRGICDLGGGVATDPRIRVG